MKPILRSAALCVILMTALGVVACSGDTGSGGGNTLGKLDAGTLGDVKLGDTAATGDVSGGETSTADTAKVDTGAPKDDAKADTAAVDAAGDNDTGTQDVGQPEDTATVDAGGDDAATPDTEQPDTAAPDTEAPDTTTPDSATSDAEEVSVGCKSDKECEGKVTTGPCTEAACDVESGLCKTAPLEDGKSCDDGEVCTDADACKSGACAGTPKVCDDKNPCTQDACTPGKGCESAPSTGSCDDGNACTKDDTCSSGTCSGVTVVCDDKNPCTDDTCEPALGCVAKPLTGPACDDGDGCTTGDKCADGVCKGTGGQDCDDANPCTDDACEAGKGCIHAPATGAPCSDDDPCTQGDACDAGACVAGKPIVCDDANPCTTDACDKKSGSCTFTNNSAACDDGDACTIGDTCVEGGCKGAPKTCNDSNPCTADACDKTTGNCSATPASGDCDDGNACTENDVCTEGTCKGAGITCDDKNPCTDDTCDKAKGCTFTPNAATCDDGSVCTKGDVCKEGTCAGDAVNCDDQNACTEDICDPQTGCANNPNTASCDDGDACTNGDMCSGGGCKGAPINCDDDNACTDDSCDPKSGCVHANNTKPCDDGDSCTTGDACSAGKCAATGKLGCDDANTCTNDSCEPKLGCVYTYNTNPCDDGNPCSTGDVCAKGLCKGVGPNCDDNNPCTKDGCTNGICSHTKILSGACNDGNACTTGEVCASGVCGGGKALNCDDGNACTNDACDGIKGCTHVNADGAKCTDNNACTKDVCQGGKCTATSVDCDDKNPCTNDSCDPVKGCLHANNTASCNDANACTTGEKCGGGVCGGGAAKVCNDFNPCTNDSCDPKTAGCVFAVNAACASKALPLVDPLTCGAKDWSATPLVGGVGWAVDATPANPGKTVGCSLNYNNGSSYPGQTTGTVVSAFFVDATKAAKVALAFTSFNGVENDAKYDARYVEASTDGFNTLAAQFKLDNAYGPNKWTTEGFDLSALKGKKFQLRFRLDTVDAANNSGPGWFVEDINVYDGPIVKAVAGQTFVEPFALGNANGWQMSLATGNVAWAIDATPAAPAPFDGNATLNFNNGTNYTTSVAPSGTALSPVLDLTGLAPGSNVSIAFRSWSDVEPTNGYDQRWIEVSGDSFLTLNVANQLSNLKGQKGWTIETVDLSPLVGQRVRLRFRFNAVDGVNNGGKGWFVDNLVLTPHPVLPFADGIVASDTTRWTINNSTPTVGWAIDALPSPAFSSGDASLNFNNGTNFTCPGSAKSVTGKATSGTFKTAKVAGTQKLVLRFKAYLGVESTLEFDVTTVTVKDTAQAKEIKTTIAKTALGSWTNQEIDITSLAGGSLQIVFEFDSVDCVDNGGAGVFIDDVYVAYP